MTSADRWFLRGQFALFFGCAVLIWGPSRTYWAGLGYAVMGCIAFVIEYLERRNERNKRNKRQIPEWYASWRGPHDAP